MEGGGITSLVRVCAETGEGGIRVKTGLGVGLVVLAGVFLLPVLTYAFLLGSVLYLGYEVWHRDMAKGHRWGLALFGTLIAVRMAGFLYVLFATMGSPPPISARSLWHDMGIAQFAAWADGGLIESRLGSRREDVREALGVFASRGAALDDLSGHTGTTGTLSGYRDPYRPDDGCLSWVREGRGVRLYSFGPDRTDEGGALLYDPTNGMGSGGDIVVVVTRLGDNQAGH